MDALSGRLSLSWRTTTSNVASPLRRLCGRRGRASEAKAAAPYSGRGTTRTYSLSTDRSPLSTMRMSSSGVPSGLASTTWKCESVSHCCAASSCLANSARTWRSIAATTSTAASPPDMTVCAGLGAPTSFRKAGSDRKHFIWRLRTRKALGRVGAAMPATRLSCGTNDGAVVTESDAPRGETGIELMDAPKAASCPLVFGSSPPPPDVVSIGYANDAAAASPAAAPGAGDAGAVCAVGERGALGDTTAEASCEAVTTMSAGPFSDASRSFSHHAPGGASRVGMASSSAAASFVDSSTRLDPPATVLASPTGEPGSDGCVLPGAASFVSTTAFCESGDKSAPCMSAHSPRAVTDGARRGPDSGDAGSATAAAATSCADGGAPSSEPKTLSQRSRVTCRRGI
mmetsp:Transcript_5079/g.16089  ORF Transcript_5079/g.16089 Transcript_5079/m.16089 type:complete len:400 (+) Transcript_5079:607-1806(+)